MGKSALNGKLGGLHESDYRHNGQNMKKLGTVKNTERGFEVIGFKDYYGSPCSIQQSSLAIYEQPGSSAIWIGVDDPNPQVMAVDAASCGIIAGANAGWVPYPIPEQVLINTRMHLTREGVSALIPVLQQWLETGSFKKPRTKNQL